MRKIGENPKHEEDAKLPDYLQQHAIGRRQRPTRQIVAALKRWLQSLQTGEGKVELPVIGRALGQDRDKEPTMYGGTK